MARRVSNGKEDPNPPVEEPKPTKRTPRKKKVEPKLTDMTVSVRSGGTVGMVGFGNLKADFSIFASRNYDVTGMTDEEAEDFYNAKYIEMREHTDKLAQIEFDQLMGDSALFDANGEYIGSK